MDVYEVFLFFCHVLFLVYYDMCVVRVDGSRVTQLKFFQVKRFFECVCLAALALPMSQAVRF